MKIKVKEMSKDNYSLYYSVDYKNKTNNKVAIDYLIYEILEKEENNNIDNLISKMKSDYLKRKESEEND